MSVNKNPITVLNGDIPQKNAEEN